MVEWGDHLTPVQRAFSKQAAHYDADDASNPVLIDWREKVYRHVARHVKPSSRILEVNAGTGIDALHFASLGHPVVATDISPGMIEEIKKKAQISDGRLQVRQCSFEQLNELKPEKFDCVFSNFGGLNCCEDLSRVAKHLPALLQPNGFVVWVIMPPVCPWELVSIVRGRRDAFRRLERGGTRAHLEGEYFQTFYHSLSDIRKALGRDFKLIEAEGLGALSPPPSSSIAQQKPTIYRGLKKLDSLATRAFPFNRWADHIISSFQFRP